MTQPSNNDEQQEKQVWLARRCAFFPFSTNAEICVVFAIIAFFLILVVPMMPDTRNGHVPDAVGVPLDAQFAKDVEQFPAWLRFMIQVRCAGWFAALAVSALVGVILGFALFVLTKIIVRQ
jgi:hypothetical protein